MATWLFQGNPDSYDIDGYLASRTRIHWTIRQAHLAPEMAVGDEVFLWRAIGSSRDREVSGVVASGVLAEKPGVYEDDAREFWRTPDAGGAALRVAINLTKVASKREVLKRDWMLEDPVLFDLGVLKQAQATNFRVTDAQAARLRRLWSNTGRDWDRNESIAGLWAYDQTFRTSISKNRGSVVSNVALLIGRAIPGVYNKVMNFRSLDPRDDRQGLTGAGEVDAQVWAEFYDSESRTICSDLLDDEFRKAWAGHEPHDNMSVQRPVYAEFGEAPNDNPSELRNFLRAVRRGQPAFRRNLLAAYEGKCCISGWCPEAVLEAAHIEEHAKAGLNSIGNGLLLRSDLHALFDEGLLRVDPERLVVVLDSELQGTPYWDFNGRPLRLPVKGEGPRRDLLAARYQRQRSP